MRNEPDPAASRRVSGQVRYERCLPAAQQAGRLRRLLSFFGPSSPLQAAGYSGEHNKVKKGIGVMAVSLSLVFMSMSFARADCFKDIPEGHWAHPAVKFLSGKGVFKGFQDGTFKGTQYVTRDEFVTIMNRLIEALEKELGVKVEKVK